MDDKIFNSKLSQEEIPCILELLALVEKINKHFSEQEVFTKRRYNDMAWEHLQNLESFRYMFEEIIDRAKNATKRDSSTA